MKYRINNIYYYDKVTLEEVLIKFILREYGVFDV